MFRYYHNVDLFSLREAGVRTFRDMEDMIEGHCFADPIPGYKETYLFTGFTSESKALQVIIRNSDADFITLGVRKPTVEEIIRHFCRYCNSKNRNT